MDRTVVSYPFRHGAASQELRSRAMSIQFAGSKSLDDRRRRRLVVNTDDPDADGMAAGEGPLGSGVLSELVASSAAAPWVPIHEWRLWTYVALIGLVVCGAAFALMRPMAFRPELSPLTRHLLQGERPVLAVLIQTTFCFLAAQLAVLIGWYRAQCKLDFRGHYRVWPWAAVMLAITAVCSATDAHGLLGLIIERSSLLPWRPRVVSWLLPASVMALPLIVLLDRDVRRGRSSLYTLRVAWGLAVVSAWLELFAGELQFLEWTGRVRVILPMFVMATLFVGLWLHARVVAYVCPDPPDAGETTAYSQLIAGWRWIAARFVWRRRVVAPAADGEAETKPKRGRRKGTSEDEEDSAPKRKRRSPAKRVSKPRTRVKPAEVDEELDDDEEAEEEQALSCGDESADTSENDETDSEDAGDESNEWEDEEQEAPPSRSSRDAKPSPQVSSSKKPVSSGSEPEQTPSESDDDDDAEDAILRRDTGMTSEQMKGLTKRQKRELRRQARDQQRNQRR